MNDSTRLSRPIAALTIAGSDSGGGAGIQADLRTFAAHGLLGCTAITAVTAQNTVGVREVALVEPAVVRAQIDAVLDDLPVRAAKTGMLGDERIVRAVVDDLSARPSLPLVVDPVLVATSGDYLLSPAGMDAVRRDLLPLATVVTPNLPEARALLQVERLEDPVSAARAVQDLTKGRAAVVLKGGHDTAADRSVDLVVLPGGCTLTLDAPRHPTRSTHGTGCTLSAAIAANLALGLGIEAAIGAAKAYITGAIAHALPMGAGHGPVDHLWRVRRHE